MKIKLADISVNPFQERWNSLKSTLAESGTEFEFSLVPSTPENFKENLAKTMSMDFDVIKFGLEYYDRAMELAAQSSFDILRNQACNLFLKDKGGWWPKVTVGEAIVLGLSKLTDSIDLNSPALISGATKGASQIVSALLSLGFETFGIVGGDEVEGLKLIKDLEKVYFKTKFTFITRSRITMIPGIYSMFVNIEQLTFEKEWMEDLYFFNFLKPGSVVVDLNVRPVITPLLEEAKILGARLLTGDIVAAEEDLLMLELLSVKKPELQSYSQALRKSLDSLPFDNDPYHKRFRGRVS